MINKILILGATGKLGRVLTKTLLSNNYKVKVLVRNPEKLRIIDKNLNVLKGDVTNRLDLIEALSGVDAVVSCLGHGFRTKYPIQEKTMSVLIPLMEENKTKRVVVVTGEGLLTDHDVQSVTSKINFKIFSLVDPYRMSDAQRQQELLNKSKLDWTVIRTPVHRNDGVPKVSSIGFSHLPIWKTISRTAVSEFISECIEKNLWIRKPPIIS